MKNIEAMFKCQKELSEGGPFFQTEMAQFAEQLAFEKGVEFIIEKACEWLEKNSELYSYRELDEYDMQYYARIDKKKMIVDFRKAMEE